MSAIQQLARTEFRQKHGRDCVLAEGWLLFPDGARMEEAGWGCTEEPPTDRRELTRRKVVFHKIKLKQAVEAFDRVQQVLKLGEPIAPRVNGVDVGPDPIAKLTALRDEAVACKRRLDIAEMEQRLANPERLGEAAADSHRTAKQNAFKSAVEAITI